MALGDSYTMNGQVRVSDAEAREHQASLLAKRTTDIPNDLQIRMTYTADGLEEYIGYGARGLASSDSGWLIRKQTYNGDGYISLSQTAYGIWDNRASLTYA